MKFRSTLAEGIFYYIATFSILHFIYKLIGFPDGHLTEYDHFHKNVILVVFMLVDTAMLGLMIINTAKHKSLKWIRLSYLVFWAFYYISTYFFSQILENGQGG
jgi:hypothetical protein